MTGMTNIERDILLLRMAQQQLTMGQAISLILDNLDKELIGSTAGYSAPEVKINLVDENFNLQKAINQICVER
jgi:hypothetical protein